MSSLRENLVGDTPHLEGLVLTPCLEDDKEGMPSCGKCAGKVTLRRVGVFSAEQGEPPRYLTMRKPADWAGWGDGSDHLWFPEDACTRNFIII